MNGKLHGKSAMAFLGMRLELLQPGLGNCVATLAESCPSEAIHCIGLELDQSRTSLHMNECIFDYINVTCNLF